MRSEVGKLVKRLCVLLCVQEADHDHFSLYVEGTPYTILPEVRMYTDVKLLLGMYSYLGGKF